MILCIIQARLGSTRLPGKVLMPLGERTALGNVIHRVQKCRLVDAIVVACPYGDKEIIQETINCGAQYFTGDEHNVLERYYKAAKFFNADKIIRITADCPYIMPDLIDRLIEEVSHSAYGSNTIKRTYPKGLDCEIFPRSQLCWAYQSTHTEYDIEHVTPYMKRVALKASCEYSMIDNEDYSHIRLTLDTQEDYTQLTRLYKDIGSVYNYSELKEYLRGLDNG